MKSISLLTSTALALVLILPAAAQQNSGGGLVPGAIVNITSINLFATIQSATCASGTSAVAAAVDVAVAAGSTNIQLPPNCTYIPTVVAGHPAIPANVTIVGSGPTTVILSAADITWETTDIYLGANSAVANVAVQGLFCYANVSPINTVKQCPTNFVSNSTNTARPLHNWWNDNVLNVGTNTVNGVTYSQTARGFIVSNWGGGADGANTGGDDFYAQNELSCSGCSGMRIITQSTASGDNGLYILNGQNQPSVVHFGVHINEFTTASGAYSQWVSRSVANAAPSFRVDDNNSILVGGDAETNPMFQLVTSHQTSGDIFSLFHNTSTFTGNILRLNMASGSGSFTGNFEKYQNNSATKWQVSSDGSLLSAGIHTINLNATAAPSAIGGSPLLQATPDDSSIGTIDLLGFAATSYHEIRRANGTNASPTAVVSPNVLGEYGFGGYDGTAWAANTGYFFCAANETWAVGSHGTRCGMIVTTPGTTTQYTAIDASSGVNGEIDILLNNGAANQKTLIKFEDSGTIKWQLQKDTSNNFILFDQVQGVNALQVTAAGVTTLGETAKTTNLQATTLQINGTAGVSCAAGSVVLATEVVTNGIVTHC